MKNVYFTLIIGLSFFIACQNSGSSADNKSEIKVDARYLPDTAVKRYIGMFGTGIKGSFFKPCGADTLLYSVIDDSGEAKKKHKAALPYGYDGQTVMARVEGTLQGKPTEGGVDNVLKINKILSMEAKTWDDYCFGFEFVVFNFKPTFWSVEISKREGYIDFNDADNYRYYHFPYNAPKTEGSTRVYEATGPDGTIKITMEQKECNDGKASRPYPWSGTVVLNGKTYNGCAQW